jgi:AcrR family transcriptional regulator
VTRTTTGVYGGRTAEQRRAERRVRLVDAAREIWLEQGWAAVTMRGVCARAGLTDRYFYESFADVDALLAGVWDEVRDGTLQLLMATFVATTDLPPLAQLRAGISAFVRYLADDAARAQIFIGDHAGSVVLEQRRRETLLTFTELIETLARPHLLPGVDDTTLRITVLMGIGGFQELIIAWHGGLIASDAETIIDQAARVGESLGERLVAPGRRPPGTSA